MVNICKNGRCSNTFGSYMCTCNNGFELAANAIECIDVNECQADPFVCGVGQCVNTPGGFECVCPEGYMLGTYGLKYDVITQQLFVTRFLKAKIWF